MVGIVVVSHSEALARGVVELARQMAPPELIIEAAGGIGEEDVLGTSAELVRASVERAMSPHGVLVLVDLGSAVLSAELALEDFDRPYRLSNGPLVEGALMAAVEASIGADLAKTLAAAEGAKELVKVQR